MIHWRTRLRSLLLSGIVLFGAGRVSAQDAAPAGAGELSVRRPGDLPAGIKAKADTRAKDPMLGISVQSIDVDAEIQGLTARTTTTYTFKNDSDAPAECKFTFPLPENAAVDRFAMTVNDKDLLEGTAVYAGDADAIYKDLLAGNDGTCTAPERRPKITLMANVGYGGSVPHAGVGGYAIATPAHTVRDNHGPLSQPIMTSHTTPPPLITNRYGTQRLSPNPFLMAAPQASTEYEFRGVTFQSSFGASQPVFSSGGGSYGLDVKPQVVPGFQPIEIVTSSTGPFAVRPRDPGVLERLSGDLYRATIFAVEPHKSKTVVVSCVHPLAVNSRPAGLSEAVYRLPFMGLGTLAPAPRLMLHSVVRKPDVGASISASPTSGISRQGDDILLQAEIAKPANTSAWTIAVSSPAAEALTENGCGVQVYRPTAKAPGCFAVSLLPDAELGNTHRPMDVLFAVEAVQGLSDADRKQRRDFLAAVFNTLTLDDRVGLVALGEQPVPLASELEPATRGMLRDAECLIDGLEAGSAVAIRTGISQLAKLCGPRLDRRVNIVYLGSGQGAIPSAVRAELRELLAARGAELFTVRFGSQSTRDPILNAARERDGLAVLSGTPVTELEPGVNGTDAGTFFGERLRRPVLHDAELTLTTADGQSAVLANPVQGGLFLNEVHTCYGSYAKAGDARVTLTGVLHGLPYRREWTVPLPTAEKDNAALEKLWARLQTPLAADGNSANIELYLAAIKQQVANRNVAFLVLDNEARYKKLKIERPIEGITPAKLSPEFIPAVAQNRDDEVIGVRK